MYLLYSSPRRAPLTTIPSTLFWQSYCIARVMELVNFLYAEEANISGAAMPEILEKVALMLAPFAPYVSQDMWEELGKEGPVFRQCWPVFDPELAKEDEAEIVVQVNEPSASAP